MSRTPPAALKSVLLNTPEIELWPAGLLRARIERRAHPLWPLFSFQRLER